MFSKVFFLLNLAILTSVIAVSPVEKCRGDCWTVVSEYSEKPICVKAFITDNDLTYDEAATMCTKEEAQPAPMQNDEQKNAIKAAVEKEFRTNTRLTKSRYQIYLGAYHSAVPVGSHGKLYWIWDRTEVAGYTNWDEGQPDIEAFDKNQHEDCLMFPWSRASGGTAKWHDTACDCKKENKCIARTGGIVCAKWANDARKPPIPLNINTTTTTTTTTTETTVIDEDDKVFEDILKEHVSQFPCDEVPICPIVRKEAFELLDKMAAELPHKSSSERKEFIKGLKRNYFQDFGLSQSSWPPVIELNTAYLQNHFLSDVTVNYRCDNMGILVQETHETKEKDVLFGRVGCVIRDWMKYKYIMEFEHIENSYEINIQMGGISPDSTFSSVTITFNEKYKIIDLNFNWLYHDCDEVNVCSH